jgi:hypothetical protein
MTTSEMDQNMLDTLVMPGKRALNEKPEKGSRAKPRRTQRRTTTCLSFLRQVIDRQTPQHERRHSNHCALGVFARESRLVAAKADHPHKRAFQTNFSWAG